MRTNKISILLLVVVLLAIFNIAMVVTVFYNKSKESDAILVETNMPAINGKYFRQIVGFSNEQMDVFRSSNRIFRREANNIINNIETQKNIMFIELQEEQPDVEKLKRISSEIGLLHSELKKSTIKFYLSLKDICDNEQEEKLKAIFTPLFTSNQSCESCCN